MADPLSVTTFVVGDRLPWAEEPDVGADSGPLDAALIYNGGARQECELIKVSALGATVCGELTKVPGQNLAIELGTGQRVAGKIAWVRGQEAGFRFNQAVDILALINRKLVSLPLERRAMPRVELRCNVYLKWGGNVADAFLRNISGGGLQIEGSLLPDRGTFISVFIDGLHVPAGEVVWRNSDLVGVRLLEELSWSSIMPWIRGIVRKS